MNESLHEFFLTQLNKMYDAEISTSQALPQMASLATDPGLRDTFNHHWQQTTDQINRLEQAFSDLNTQFDGSICQSMRGLLDDGAQVMVAMLEPAVKDAALIGAAQQVEHFEIATYGTLCAMAKQMGHLEVAELLSKSLEEEWDMDKALSKLAEGGVFSSGINREANRAA